MSIRSKFRAVVDRIKAFGRKVQAVFVHASLYLIYIFGIGAAKLWARAFHRRLLRPSPSSAGTYWLDIPPNQFSEEESSRQS